MCTYLIEYFPCFLLVNHEYSIVFERIKFTAFLVILYCKSVNYNISKFKVYDYYLQKIVDLLNNTNTWLHYNQVAFVVSMILVAFEESQNVRAYAGILLNNFVMYEIILKCSVHLG